MAIVPCTCFWPGSSKQMVETLILCSLDRAAGECATIQGLIQGQMEHNIEKQKIKDRKKCKFDSLLNKDGGKQNSSSVPQRSVVNQSSKMLSTSQTAVLAKGLNFAPAPQSIPLKEIVSCVEYALQKVPQEAANDTRLPLISLLRDAKSPQRNIVAEEERAISALKRERDPVILPAEKGHSDGPR